MERHYNVLFLCTGNSARSILAEAILNKRGFPTFTAYSAGSHPKGVVHPAALRQLEQVGLPAFSFRSKSWEEFAKPSAPKFDFIITVCDNAANETCPVWPGHPITAHWGIPDPAAVQGTDDEIARAFNKAYVDLERRIDLFLALPFASLEQMVIKQEMNRIGRK
jgi:arsenate reductase (thioredoxin)